MIYFRFILYVNKVIYPLSIHKVRKLTIFKVFINIFIADYQIII